MKLRDMNPAPYNPRSISDEARTGLSNSIKEFGLVEPIIFNKRTGNIVGGHQRFKELTSQGIEETDVVIVDLPITKEKALNVTLNNKKIQGDFIELNLSSVLEDIKRDPDINIEELNLSSILAENENLFSGNTKEENKERKQKKLNNTAFEVSNFSCPVSLEDHGVIHETLRKIKQERKIDTTGEALMIVFQFYIDQAGE